MLLWIHAPDSSADHSGDPSIERLNNEVRVMSFLTQIFPVKRGDPGIQVVKAIYPTVQPDPVQELSLGVQQARHETRELCVCGCRSHRRSYLDDPLNRIAARRGIFRSA